MSTIQTSGINAELEIRDSNGDLTPVQAGALRGTAVAVPPIFQDSAGTPVGTLCRAWVNFNGTGTVAIRGSFNVSSITDNGTGNYTVNFTTPMPNADFCTVPVSNSGTSVTIRASQFSTQTTGTVQVLNRTFATGTNTGALEDPSFFSISIFA